MNSTFFITSTIFTWPRGIMSRTRVCPLNFQRGEQGGAHSSCECQVHRNQKRKLQVTPKRHRYNPFVTFNSRLSKCQFHTLPCHWLILNQISLNQSRVRLAVIQLTGVWFSNQFSLIGARARACLKHLIWTHNCGVMRIFIDSIR